MRVRAAAAFILTALSTVHLSLGDFNFSTTGLQHSCGDQLLEGTTWTVHVEITFSLEPPPTTVVKVQLATTDHAPHHHIDHATDPNHLPVVPLCEFSLADCAGTQQSMTPDLCKCVQDGGLNYSITVERQARRAEAGRVVEALVYTESSQEPDHLELGVVASVMAEVVDAIYCIDQGEERRLEDHQTISVCGGGYTGVRICVTNVGPRPHLMMYINEQTVQANQSCIHTAEIFNFKHKRNYQVVFVYDEDSKCPRPKVALMYFKPKDSCAVVGNQSSHSHSGDRPPRSDSFCLPQPRSSSREVAVLDSGIEVLCDTETDGGGWVVFQRRVSLDVDFVRNWANYTEGFGDFSDSFWLGLDKLHSLCNPGSPCQLRIDMEKKGVSKHALYDIFYIFGPGEMYRLHVGNYSGTAGDGLIAPVRNGRVEHPSVLNGMSFSTFDRDNDGYPLSCAQLYKNRGGWWYNRCYLANLNELWGENAWFPFSNKPEHLDFSEMKLRKKN